MLRYIFFFFNKAYVQQTVCHYLKTELSSQVHGRFLEHFLHLQPHQKVSLRIARTCLPVSRPQAVHSPRHVHRTTASEVALGTERHVGQVQLPQYHSQVVRGESVTMFEVRARHRKHWPRLQPQ